jgi:hypothetical protein
VGGVCLSVVKEKADTEKCELFSARFVNDLETLVQNDVSTVVAVKLVHMGVIVG